MGPGEPWELLLAGAQGRFWVGGSACALRAGSRAGRGTPALWAASGPSVPCSLEMGRPCWHPSSRQSASLHYRFLRRPSPGPSSSSATRMSFGCSRANPKPDSAPCFEPAPAPLSVVWQIALSPPLHPRCQEITEVLGPCSPVKATHFLLIVCTHSLGGPDACTTGFVPIDYLPLSDSTIITAVSVTLHILFPPPQNAILSPCQPGRHLLFASRLKQRLPVNTSPKP